ncbi:MAG: hypothetical protein M3M85_02700 [bacterium]|nr:hypothetical protein [bacterium]
MVPQEQQVDCGRPQNYKEDEMSEYQSDNNSVQQQVPEIDVSSFANRFDSRVGWLPFFQSIANLGVELWVKYELTLMFLSQGITDLKRAVFSPDKFKEYLLKKHAAGFKVAKEELRGNYRKAIENRKRNLKTHSEAETSHRSHIERAKAELERLVAKQAHAQNNLDKGVVGLAGTKEAQIHAPKKLAGYKNVLKHSAVGVLGLLIAVLEVIIGKGGVATQGDETEAQIVVAAIVLVAIVLIESSMTAIRGFIVWLVAKFRFRAAQKDGILPEGAQLVPYPGSKIVQALVTSFLIFFVSGGMFFYRLWISATTTTGVASQETGGYMIPVVMMVLILGSAVLAYVLRDDYTEEQYTEIDRLRGELKIAKENVEDEEEAFAATNQPLDHNTDSYTQQIAKAEAWYNQSTDSLVKDILAEPERMEKFRRDLPGHLQAYRNMFELYDHTTQRAMNRVIDLVSDANDSEEELPAITDEIVSDAGALFSKKAKRTFDTPEIQELMEKATFATFEIELPTDLRVTDFESLLEEVEESLEEKPAEVTKRKRIGTI